MRSRALILTLVAPLLATAGPGPGHADATDDSTPERAAAIADPRLGEVTVAGAGASLVSDIHVDAGLQRIGLSISFTRPDATTWGRVWLGERNGNGGCTREVVVQGRSTDASAWVVREAGGGAVPVDADYSASGFRQLRVELDRPALPDACTVAELWSGTTSGPTQLISAGDRDVTRGILERSVQASFPVKYRLWWGETTTFPVSMSSALTQPSAITDVTVAFGTTTSQGPVVDASAAPLDWDFWADGPTHVDLPVTPTAQWGTRVLPSVTADEGTRVLGTRRVFIRHKPPTDWDGTLAGRRYWHPDNRLGSAEFPSLTFLDDTWVYLHFNGKVVPECTQTSPRWGFGCQRYWYDADTGRLQIGQLRARVTDTGWWWQDEAWDRSYRVRTFARGETRRYHGVGRTQICCTYPRAEVWLRKDGSYRIVRGKQDQRGHYKAIGSSRLRLDAGPRGGRTRVVQLDFFGVVDDGAWQLRRVRLGNTLTLPD